MSINEMIKNVKALTIPGLNLTFSMSVDEINEVVRNAIFERFVSEVVTDSELCGVSPMDSRKFAIDFIHNSDYVQNYLTAAVNLVLNGAFSEKCQLDSFINRLLWTHVVIDSHIGPLQCAQLPAAAAGEHCEHIVRLVCERQITEFRQQ